MSKKSLSPESMEILHDLANSLPDNKLISFCSSTKSTKEFCDVDDNITARLTNISYSKTKSPQEPSILEEEMEAGVENLSKEERISFAKSLPDDELDKFASVPAGMVVFENTYLSKRLSKVRTEKESKSVAKKSPTRSTSPARSVSPTRRSTSPARSVSPTRSLGSKMSQRLTSRTRSPVLESEEVVIVKSPGVLVEGSTNVEDYRFYDDVKKDAVTLASMPVSLRIQVIDNDPMAAEVVNTPEYQDALTKVRSVRSARSRSPSPARESRSPAKTISFARAPSPTRKTAKDTKSNAGFVACAWSGSPESKNTRMSGTAGMDYDHRLYHRGGNYYHHDHDHHDHHHDHHDRDHHHDHSNYNHGWRSRNMSRSFGLGL